MGEIFNLDDMIKKEMKGFKKDENSSAKPSEYLSCLLYTSDAADDTT